jgi:hypothetical protein
MSMVRQDFDFLPARLGALPSSVAGLQALH